MNLKIVSSTLLLTAASPLMAVNFNSGAGINSGFASSNGTDLAPGSVVLVGTFTISESTILANITNYSFLNSNFVVLDNSYIGEGNPALGTSESDTANAGLFLSAVSSINTSATGLNVSGSSIYYWVFNSSTPASASEYGIFSSTTWTVPAGDGTPVDLASITTDIADLTVSQGGTTLAGTAKILFGGFGSGTNISGGGRDFLLAPISAIPEPSSFAALAGLGILGLASMRRRRSA